MEAICVLHGNLRFALCIWLSQHFRSCTTDLSLLDAGSQVHYRSSSDAPVLVQGCSAAAAAGQAVNDVDRDTQVGIGQAVHLWISADLLLFVLHVTFPILKEATLI